MSYQEPAASGYELTASEIDPAHHAIVPSDDTQDLAFRSIRAIDAKALVPYGSISLTPERRTPKGIRPMIWVCSLFPQRLDDVSLLRPIAGIRSSVAHSRHTGSIERNEKRRRF